MDNIEEIRAQLGRVDELTADELRDLDESIAGAIEDVAGGELNDETMAILAELDEGLVKVRDAVTAREQADQERRSQADAILARARGEEAEAEAEEAGDAETPNPDDPNGEGDGDGEGEGEGEGDKPAGDTPPAPEGEEEEAAEAIAAAARAANAPAPTQPTLGRIAARRPKAAAPKPKRNQLALVASADVPGMISVGREFRDLTQVAEAIVKKHNAFRGRATAREQIPIVSMQWSYPRDRMLDLDDAAKNHDLIQNVVSLEAITAAGGLCAPLAGYYALPGISSAVRPIRDALAQFGAERGGIRYQPALQLTDLDGSVDVWTVANDANPSDPSTKPCLAIDCGVEQQALIEAITRCLQFGNLGARAWPEQVARAIDLSLAAHARLAERELFSALVTGSLAMKVGEVLGTTRSVLAGIARAAVGYRQRHRTGLDYPLRAIFPGWLRDNMVVDLIRELPGAPADRLRIANAEINAFFAARNINVTWSLEAASAAQEMSIAQAGGPTVEVNGWPGTVTGLLFHEGSWLFLDGGTLDLGLVRDSTLNSTNDYQMFAETFEGTAFVGVESDAITFDICPDGSSSATVDISPCTTGS